MKLPKFVVLLILTFVLEQGLAANDIYDSGGPLMPEQASFDITYYDLSLFVDPADSNISGSLMAKARIVQPLDIFVLDLDTLLKISDVQEINDKKPTALNFTHINGKVRINLMWTRQAGEDVIIKLYYGGRPRIAPSPPWSGGFTWAKTATGSPWIATSCQGEGADIWWPNKDHVSDKPDSMRMHIRVQDPLVVASNGRLESVESHDDNTSTYHWFVSTPISNYNIALNIAPYKVISENYTSVAGDVFSVSFWVLPEDYEKGVAFFPEIIEHLAFFEKHLGPYPFRADKYGVAQTPHLGMEHQTIIAYGGNFNNAAMTRGEDWGFDALHHHELSHEWWGNVVTNSDWRDMWIHEGFGTYMQCLYLEETQGIEKYHEYLKSLRGFWNLGAIAPVKYTTSEEISGISIYFKGAWILNTLRHLIGEDQMRILLRQMIYPDPQMERITDGRQVRFVSTMDFLYLAESITGKDLDWFFDVYLRQPELPLLVSKIENDRLTLRWEIPQGLSFPMPVEIKMGNTRKRIEIPSEGTRITIDKDILPVIDPDNWILKRDPYPEVIALDNDQLDKYPGSYEVTFRSRTIKVKISKEGSALYLQTGRFPKIEIFPQSRTEFFAKIAENVRIKFNFDDNDEIESLTHNFFPREATLKKTN